ncbi:hypothetical protein FA95DRAFT_1565033, partial [Auriscalpium vulgare]
MARLPLEVQILIIECVYRLSQAEAVDYAALRACALVCRAWTPIAQRLLFRRVPSANLKTDNLDALPLLLRTLRTSPHLSAAVRSARLAMCHANITADVELLNLCPHIQNVWVEDLLEDYSMFPALETRLCTIPLRSVALRAWGEPSFVGLFLSAWPSIRALELDGQSILDPRDTLPPISASGALQVLTLNEDDVPWALAQENNFTALRDLQLLDPAWYEDGWMEQLHRSDILRGIHTLRVEGVFPPQDVLERIGQLKSLVFELLPKEDFVLPQSLRHVGYHPWDAEVVVASHAVAALCALADLKLVTATRFARPKHLVALEEVCRDRGVEFETYRTPHHFPNPRWDA